MRQMKMQEAAAALEPLLPWDGEPLFIRLTAPDGRVIMAFSVESDAPPEHVERSLRRAIRLCRGGPAVIIYLEISRPPSALLRDAENSQSGEQRTAASN